MGLSLGIVPELWSSTLIEQLRPDNSFESLFTNDDMWVVGGDTVHKPKAGADPNVEVNRTTFPATISSKTDTDLKYSMSSFTSDPQVIRNIEQIQLVYNKRESMLRSHSEAIRQKFAKFLLWRILDVRLQTTTNVYTSVPLPTGNILDTTGAANVRNKKSVTKTDIIHAVGLFNAKDVPSGDRYMLIPAEMYSDIQKIDDFMTADKIGTANIPAGSIGQIYGVNVMMRSTAGVYNNAGVLQDYNHSFAPTDNHAIVMWSKSGVSRAKGSIKIFLEEDKPDWYGTVMSAEMLGGAMRDRDESVVVIKQVDA